MILDYDYDDLMIAGINESLKMALRADMNAKEAAVAAYTALSRIADVGDIQFGDKPAVECFLREPGYSEENDRAWWVVWESGPAGWGIAASFAAMDALGNRLVETQWGLDLLFYIDVLGE